MSELDYQRRNTKAFIDADPISLTLQKQNRVSLSDGGYRVDDPTPRAPQTFRMIPQSDVMPVVQTPDGHQLTPSYVLLGTHDCLMERWDKFTFNGVEFQIVSPIRPDFRLVINAYERKADVARL